jgi:hypothetical protein
VGLIKNTSPYQTSQTAFKIGLSTVTPSAYSSDTLKDNKKQSPLQSSMLKNSNRPEAMPQNMISLRVEPNNEINRQSTQKISNGDLSEQSPLNQTPIDDEEPF